MPRKRKTATPEPEAPAAPAEPAVPAEEHVEEPAPAEPEAPPEPKAAEPAEPAANDRLNEARVRLDDARAQFDAAKAEFDAAQHVVDRLIEATEAGAEKHSMRNQREIKRYIETQKKQRAERGLRARALTDHGLDLHSFGGKAPIDQAMTRKTGYGHNRPAFQRPAGSTEQ